MIYQFRCHFPESEEFLMEVDTDASHTFWELHQVLQSALGFQSLDLASFLIPRAARRHRDIEVTQLNPGQHKSFVFSMQNTLIGDILIPGRRLLRYVFDLMNARYLHLELTGTNMEKNLRKPMVKLNRGESPVQVLEEVLSEGLYTKKEEPKPTGDYGVLSDYYEIFGEMEEYVL